MGVAEKENATFFREWGCHFYLKKNKLKSEMFNAKKSLETKVFFSVTTKNSNWKL